MSRFNLDKCTSSKYDVKIIFIGWTISSFIISLTPALSRFLTATYFEVRGRCSPGAISHPSCAFRSFRDRNQCCWACAHIGLLWAICFPSQIEGLSSFWVALGDFPQLCLLHLSRSLGFLIHRFGSLRDHEGTPLPVRWQTGPWGAQKTRGWPRIY